MREIKFRAWDKRHNQMVLWIDLADIPYARENFFHYTDKEQVFMQYTGLKDKNDKEIYEGDIVKEYRNVSKIEWNHDYACFGFYEPTSFGRKFITFRVKPEVEVIGNIYENGDLIK